MKISAQALAKLHRTLGALIVSVSASLAQNTVPVGVAPPAAPPAAAPLNPPAAQLAPGTLPAAPGTPAQAGGPLAPAPIEPPIQTPGGLPTGTAPAPGDPAAAAPGAPGAATVPGTIDVGNSHVSEFQGDDVSLVLRTLARQAKMNVVVSPAVTGQITLRVENKTPMEVIRIICQANGLVMDEMESVVYIKTLAEKQKEPTESVQFTFSYAKATDIVKLMKMQFALEQDPQVDIRTNTIFFRVGKTNRSNILAFLESVDSPTKQVMIEARLVEVNANPQQSYGINWGGVVGSAATPMTVKYGASTLAPSSTAPVTSNTSGGTFQLNDFLKPAGNISSMAKGLAGQFSILSVPQMALTMQMLNEDSDVDFLANPRIVAANNEKATIKITRNQPVPQLNFNEQTAQAVFGGFQDKEFGNTLTVTPQINKDQFVTIKVQPEISNKVGDSTFTFSGATVASPIIDKRTFDSNVLIKSGDTLAIGGLLQDEITKTSNKVPIMGDVPLFGKLFQSKQNARTKRNLLVFVTPTIIKPGYGTGLENQIGGLKNSGNEFADPNGWRNNARGAFPRHKQDKPLAAEYPAPNSPNINRYKVNAAPLE
jgi:type IV pilus secretin PilQ/predicted competence protein